MKRLGKSACGSVFVFVLGCVDGSAVPTRHQDPAPQPSARSISSQQSEERLNQIFTVEITRSGVRYLPSRPLPANAYRPSTPSDKADLPGPVERYAKLSPALEKLLAQDGDRDRAVDIVVTFTEDVRIPRFPELDPSQTRASAANAAKLAEIGELISGIRASRAARYDAIALELRQRFGARELGTERSWLVPSLLVQAPLSSVTAISQRSDVQYVEPNRAAASVAQTGNDIVDGRARVNSDPYFNFTGGFIGVVDSGLRNTHTTVSAPNVFDFRRDCINGTGNSCTTGMNLDPDDSCDHGTGIVNIISGNNNLMNPSRGVTPITVDTWKIFSGCTTGFADAAKRAFEAAVASGDNVINGSFNFPENETDVVATAANAAFDAGAVVVAAAGNDGPGASTVKAPGNAKRVLAVGALDTPSLVLESFSSRGPVSGNRIKPDIVATDNIRMASISSNTALKIGLGTSMATAFTSGAAALSRNFLRGKAASINPGVVNAFLIMSGGRPSFNNDVGAGLLTLPVDSLVFSGTVDVSNKQDVNIQIDVGPVAPSVVDAAIWWPEPNGSHNDIDLAVIRPDGTQVGSFSVPSVFEKVRIDTATAPGVWTVRIRGFSVTGTQKVHWAARKG